MTPTTGAASWAMHLSHVVEIAEERVASAEEIAENIIAIIFIVVAVVKQIGQIQISKRKSMRTRKNIVYIIYLVINSFNWLLTK